MLKSGKKLMALCLSVLLIFGCLSACSNSAVTTPNTVPEAPENAQTSVPAEPVATEPVATEPVATEPKSNEPEEEKKVLRVITIGHSLAVDCGNTLNRIFAAEGTGEYDEVYIATLYYSGCPLYKHVNYLTQNAPEYNLYISSSTTPESPPTIMDNVTMYDALRFAYWDIVIMQGGVFEIGIDATYTDGNIQIIQNYVLDSCLNPNPVFAWHMAWATPTDNTLRDMYPKSPNTYYSSYEKFGSSRTNFYNCIAQCVEDHILTDETFQFMIPAGTALENALSSYLEESDIHRDYAHASDYGRVIASYVWYCRIMGVDQISEVKMDTVPVQFLKKKENGELVLTQAQKDIIIESVNNALSNPVEMTQSQYTEAPAQ